MGQGFELKYWAGIFYREDVALTASSFLFNIVMRKSNWYSIEVCSNCEHRLTLHQFMYSNGICPNCGYDSENTVCSYKNVILQKIAHHPWWRFWNKKFTYVGRNKYSQDWIDKNQLNNDIRRS